MRKPFFSLVIPTKDRPECIKILLESLGRQTFDDFEVIVSDNASEMPCKDVFDLMVQRNGAGMDYRYYRNETSLGMSDSFESAIGHANGEFVMMLGDKNILYHDALEKLYKVVQEKRPDILNFSMDYLSNFDSNASLICGKFRKQNKSGGVRKVDEMKALKKHMTCKYLVHGFEPATYAGSIFYGGGYHRSFIEKIRSLHNSGRVFDGIIPDRYGAVEALCYSNRVYWLDDNILVYGVHGKNRSTWPLTVKKGLDGMNSLVRESRKGVDYYDTLIIPGVVASAKNILASDYNNAIKNAAASNDRLGDLHVDRGYLAALVEAELENSRDICDTILEEQKALLGSFINKLSKEELRRLQKGRNDIAMDKQSKQRNTMFGIKSMVDDALGRGIMSSSKAVSSICLNLDRHLSKNSSVVMELDEIL